MWARCYRLIESNSCLSEDNRKDIAEDLKRMIDALLAKDEGLIAREWHLHKVGNKWITENEYNLQDED